MPRQQGKAPKDPLDEFRRELARYDRAATDYIVWGNGGECGLFPENVSTIYRIAERLLDGDVAPDGSRLVDPTADHAERVSHEAYLFGLALGLRLGRGLAIGGAR